MNRNRTKIKAPRLVNAWFAWFNSHNFEGGALDSREYHFTTADIDFEAIAFRGGEVLVFHVEVKSNGVESFTSSNVWSAWIVRSAFERSNGKPVRIDPIETRRLRYLGFHVLTFSGETPDLSDWIRWNGDEIDRATLFALLRFEVDPSTFQPLKNG